MCLEHLCQNCATVQEHYRIMHSLLLNSRFDSYGMNLLKDLFRFTTSTLGYFMALPLVHCLLLKN